MLYNSGFASFHASGDRRASPQTKFFTSRKRYWETLTVPHLMLQIEAFKVDKIRWAFNLALVPPNESLQGFLSQLRAKLREQTLESGESWVPERSDYALVQHIKALHTEIMPIAGAEGVAEEDKREAFLRTLTHNLTAEGTPASPEWSSMFAVLIHGPAFVPADFEFNRPEESVNERAWAYVEPYVKAFRRANLGARKLFVTEKGRFGTMSRYVFLESLALLLLGGFFGGGGVSSQLSRPQVSLCPECTNNSTISGLWVLNKTYT